MRFGVTEVRRDDQGGGGLFQGAGTAGVELIMGVILSPFILFFLGLAVWKMWPDWDERVAFVILFGLIGLGGLWLVLSILHRFAGVAGTWNRGKVIHNTEQGVTFLHGREVMTHSHVQPPINEMNGEVQDEYDDIGPPNAYGGRGQKIPKTYKDMQRMGYGGPDAELVLAFKDDGSPISMPNLTSLGIGGVQGSGKTVTTLVLMLEIVAKYNGRVKFLVVDPQLYAQSGGESLTSKIKELSPFFLQVPGKSNPTVGTAELPGWMEYIHAEQNRRQEGGDWEDVWVVIMDEFAQIMSRPESAAAVLPVLESINSIARQLEIFAILVSYEWLASLLGGTELRHAIASFAVHNLSESVAALIVPSDVARMAPKMRVGQLVFHTLGKTSIGRVPFANEVDARNAVVRYGPRRTTTVVESDPTPDEGYLVPPLDTINRGSAGYDTDKVEAIRQGVRDGLTTSKIAEEVFGNKGTYAVNQVLEILKGLV
jgi:hypothetical protein